MLRVAAAESFLGLLGLTEKLPSRYRQLVNLDQFFSRWIPSTLVSRNSSPSLGGEILPA